MRKECAGLLRDLCKHTFEICQLIVNAGGIAALVEFLEQAKGLTLIPGLMALGYISAHSDALAATAIKSMVKIT